MTMIKFSFAMVAVLSLAGVGCKKDSGAGDADCAAQISKGIDRMASARGQGKDLSPEIKAKMDEFTGKMKAVVIQRCTEDKWPAEVIACFDTVASRPDMMKCQGMLPQDQQDKVRGAVRDVMMAGGNGLGRMGGRHGGDMHGGDMHGGGDMNGGGSAAGSADGSGAAPTPAPTPAPAGSAAAPAPVPAAGSAK